MSIDDFVDILETRQLVPASVIRQVREKIANGDRRLNPKSLLKYLVKKDLLSRAQAKQLLDTTLVVSPSAESSILGMIPLPEMPAELLEDQPDDGFDDDIPTLAPLEEVPAETAAEKERESELAAISGFVTKSLEEERKKAPVEPGRRELKDKKKRSKQNQFDSPLLLLGGGGLIVLILAGVIIGYLLLREDADAVLAQAREYYNNGAYAQAVTQYDQFVKNYPRHPENSTAKVQLGIAKIWQASSAVTQYSPALETTKQVLHDIEDEKGFADFAKQELASRIPAIAQGLAGQAETSADSAEASKLVGEAREALALCDNTKYIPSGYRNEAELKQIQETLDRVERGQELKTKREQGLKDIQAAIEANNTAEAYAVYNKLIEENAGLLNDESLAAKVREISAAEQKVVRFVAESKAAETSPRPSNLVAELALAARRGPAANAQGTVTARVDGAVYALNAADGKLLWRQYVGRGPNLPPIMLAGGDLLAVDATRHELLRLKADTGKLVWRQAFDGPILSPVSLDDRLLVTEQSGKLHVLKADSGERVGYVQFGQSLPVPPAVAPRGNRIYVVGAQSSIYTLGAEDYSCLGVFYLGQQDGSIAVPPVAVLNKVLVLENSGLESCNLRVLARTEDEQIASVDTSRRLEGLVVTPLLVDGRRVVAMTTFGQIGVYEVGSGTGDEALAQIAMHEAESGPPVARFGLLDQGQVWSAGNQLIKMAILPTENRMQVRDIDLDYGGDTFDYPLQAVDKVIYHVRRAQGHAGARVAAMDEDSGKSLWETELAVPPSGAPAVDAIGPRISAITASGAAYLLDREAMSQRVQDEAQRLASDATLPPLAESADLGQGRLALSSAGSKLILHFRPDAPSSPLTAIRLPAPLTCPAVAWEGAVVAPTRVGQVYLYNGESAEQLGSPFQPPLAAEGEYGWVGPAVYGAGADARLVVSDGLAKIYLLQRVNEPAPHLEAVVEAKVSDSPLVTRLAVVGNAAFAGTKDGSLAQFALPSLEKQPEVDLDAKIVWGPFAVGDRLLLATAKDELVAVDSTGKILWRQPLGHGELCGQPLADGNGMLLLWRHGGLSRVAAEDGKETAYLELEQPAVAGPVAFGNRLLVAAADGALLVVNRPQQSAE